MGWERRSQGDGTTLKGALTAGFRRSTANPKDLPARLSRCAILLSESQMMFHLAVLRKNLALLKDNGDPRFTSKTIVNYYLIAAAVFATAKDRKGKQLFPRQWDLNYIGLPAVDKKAQNAPTVEAAEIETILSAAKNRYRVLYALLAGSGLRIAETLGLEIGKHLSDGC